ncbi:3-hydroxy-3-methylglutaryl-coenzyme A reductase [Candidatus Nitrososphaera evergladensis SR1]|uniref:3-hydroxy-3-methylglutaryl coenzyme A reductase n=1 Tax=Candidatus Nitrososphaera evergladensis SR1 TaxID=1459636 RepID=A0A075MVP0_9ARCH|nr:hydroxymethylglutaryl-CoA reductase, degradative [Candidatus Nitrososphaera evergladensis]AIF85223.1 3-hydroxy-3-methylglutaryl-coenzyme A reductase [Candidatus Nitrososphaera evergladensis SR1]
MSQEKRKFYEMDREERLAFLKESAGLTDEEAASFGQPLAFDSANRMVENAVGIMSIPLGIATNFVINGVERLVPMAIEEPSVIAAASKAAKIAKAKGGFVAETDEPLMIGQVQVVSLANIGAAKRKVLARKKEILAIANSKSRSVSAAGLQAREVKDSSKNKMGRMLVVELVIDAKDAMGANAVNTMCEAIAPRVAEITGGEVVLKILSNYATKRMVRCKAVFDRDELGGKDIVERILYAYALAHSDVYRAVTHNKGVMNGVDAVALATGQDFRAIEAGAHAWAARDGTYRSLTRWWRTKNGDLAGEIELPLAVGVVGGVANVHPTAKVALKVLSASNNAKELAMAIAAAGLAQNLAAMRALASEGIQKGHMRLHARNIAVMAGAKGADVDRVAKKIADEGQVNVEKAREVLASLRKGS